jgi:hypothetical protein
VDTDTDTPVDTASPTISPTFTDSPVDTDTDTPADTASPTVTETLTESPADTATDTPADTASPTISATLTATPASTATATATAQSTQTSVAFPESNQAKAIWGPVPVRSGDPMTLYFDKTPQGGSYQVYNVEWQNVAQDSFSGSAAYLQTASLSPGVYMVRTKIEYTDGSTRTVFQNIIVVR